MVRKLDSQLFSVIKYFLFLSLVRDQRRPRSLAPTSSPCSVRNRSRNSRRLSASSTLTRTGSSLPMTWRPPSSTLVVPSLMPRLTILLVKLQDPSTSPRWSLSSQRRWREVSQKSNKTPASKPLNLSFSPRCYQKFCLLFVHFKCSKVVKNLHDFVLQVPTTTMSLSDLLKPLRSTDRLMLKCKFRSDFRSISSIQDRRLHVWCLHCIFIQLYDSR